MTRVAILGATGYTGIELIRLLNNHPEVELIFAGSESQAGNALSEIHPQFRGRADLILDRMQVEAVPSDVGIVFCALPHGRSLQIVPELLANSFKVIDLSADFRLKKKELYKKWYGYDHPAPKRLGEAIYGLTELNKERVAKGQLIANPGCYPTSIILALAPLKDNSLVEVNSIIVDAKSGVSGAGRVPKQAFHFPDCTENFKAYRVASHQHTPEIEQELSKLGGRDTVVTFTPHLVPMIRGILSTIYLNLTSLKSEQELRTLYLNYYKECPFVRIMDEKTMPETRFVRGSNYIDIGLKLDQRTGRLVVISAIDNLVKGAAGQAVQNMNIMLGYKENTGLEQLPF